MFKSLITLIVLNVLSFIIVSQDSTDVNVIKKEIQKLINDYSLKNASISFLVKQIDNDSIIAEYNSNTSLVPASTMKIITTATALEVLTPFYNFKTILQYDGYIDSNCTLNGNIYIKGGGDPTLGSRFVNSKQLIQNWSNKIANIGITKINGKIIGDASFFNYEYIPQSWTWGDIGNYYGSGTSGLSIFDNTINYYFNSKNKQGDSTKIVCTEPYTPDLETKNYVVSWNTKKDEAYIYGAPYNGIRTIKGRIPLNRKEFKVKGSMPDPAYTAAFELETDLWKNKIPVLEKASTIKRLNYNNNYINNKRISFDTIYSVNVSKIVYWTNLISNNLFAEHLLRHIGKKTFKHNDYFHSTLAVNNFWKEKNILLSGFYINDGSGLSRKNAMSAKHLVDVLIYMKKESKYYKSFYSSLPIAGKTGTLKTIGRKTKIQGNLRAKSGTMTRVKSYAGYVKSNSGKNLCFAILVNNYTCNNLEIKKKLEKVMVSLGNF